MIFLLFILKLVHANYSVSSKLVEETVHITSKYYKSEIATSVVFTHNNSEEVNDYLIKYHGSVLITALSNDNKNVAIDTIQRFGYSQTVFFATEPDLFETFMASINKNLRRPIRLVLVLNKSVGALAEISTFIGIALKNNLSDIVIISKNQTDKITLSTYFPFSNSVCENIIPVTLMSGENMFPKKFINFHRCPIRVSALHFPPFTDVHVKDKITRVEGYDGTTLEVIVNILNASLNIKEVFGSYGSYSNGTATGIFSDVVYNSADILIPGGMLNGRYLVTQTSHVYFAPEMCWVGPKRRQIYQWIKLLRPFYNNVSLFVCLTYALFVFIAVIIRRYKQRRRDKKCSICFQVFTLLLGQTVNYVTKVPFLNNLFLLWIWFCFIIRISYQGYLVESLQNKILEPPFASLEDALKRVDAYVGTETVLEYYRDTPLEYGFKTIIVPDVYVYLKRIVEGERFLLALDKISRQQYRRHIQSLNDPISLSMQCYYMRPGWPAAQTVDSILVRLIETGIIEKIFRAEYDNLKEETDRNKKAKPLNLLTVSSCFYAMGFMWFVCSMTLSIEIIYHKYTRRSKVIK